MSAFQLLEYHMWEVECFISDKTTPSPIFLLMAMPVGAKKCENYSKQIHINKTFRKSNQHQIRHSVRGKPLKDPQVRFQPDRWICLSLWGWCGRKRLGPLLMLGRLARRPSPLLRRTPGGAPSFLPHICIPPHDHHQVPLPCLHLHLLRRLQLATADHHHLPLLLPHLPGARFVWWHCRSSATGDGNGGEVQGGEESGRLVSRLPPLLCLQPLHLAPLLLHPISGGRHLFHSGLMTSSISLIFRRRGRRRRAMLRKRGQKRKRRRRRRSCFPRSLHLTSCSPRRRRRRRRSQRRRTTRVWRRRRHDTVQLF